MERDGHESVEAKDAIPLRQAAFSLLGFGGVGGLIDLCAFRRQRACCYGGKYGADLGMAAHGFVGGDGASDLHEVNENEHESPGELDGTPGICYYGERVFSVLTAEVVVEKGAFEVLWRR